MAGQSWNGWVCDQGTRKVFVQFYVAAIEDKKQGEGVVGRDKMVREHRYRVALANTGSCDHGLDSRSGNLNR